LAIGTIGIYKESTDQYTESEMPGSFGSATGTPEQGIDETFILYAGREPGTDRAHRKSVKVERTVTYCNNPDNSISLATEKPVPPGVLPQVSGRGESHPPALAE
jgi:hypothetical protein